MAVERGDSILMIVDTSGMSVGELLDHVPQKASHKEPIERGGNGRGIVLPTSSMPAEELAKDPFAEPQQSID